MNEFIIAMSGLPVGFWSLLSVIAAGTLLKYVEKWLNKGKEQKENRDELRVEMDKLRKRFDAMEAESDAWRSKYYLNEEEIALLRAFIRGLGQEPPIRTNKPLGE